MCVELRELYDYASKFCRKWWDVDFTDEIRLVDRQWRRRWAYFRVDWRGHSREDAILTIVMSRKVNYELGREKIFGTLKHELVHWYLFRSNQPFRDDTPEFVRECLHVGAPFSGTKKAQEAVRVYGKEAQ